jgi:hypothetical protein
MENFPTNLDDCSLDIETYDELLYDNASSKKTMDEIFKKTYSIPAFKKLYTKAAALFFSTDPEIGMSVLLCYDYLYLFIECLNELDNNPNNYSFKNESYKTLLAKL